jgi:hypothetical protein
LKKWILGIKCLLATVGGWENRGSLNYRGASMPCGRFFNSLWFRLSTRVVGIASSPHSDSSCDKLTGSAKKNATLFQIWLSRPLALFIAASVSDSDRIRRHIISLSKTVKNVKILHRSNIFTSVVVLRRYCWNPRKFLIPVIQVSTTTRF